MTNQDIGWGADVQEIIIDQRFQGPSQSANGGYITGLLAEMVHGPAEVTLKAPPPLGHAMQIIETADGHALMDGEQTVATVRAVAPMELAIPPLPSASAIAEATRNYPGHHDSPIPHCLSAAPGDRWGMPCGYSQARSKVPTWPPPPGHRTPVSPMTVA